MSPGRKSFFVSGGTMPLDSESYIERSVDRELLEHLAAGRYCYVLNSRQMGKSSLSVRMIARLGARGVRTAFIDLTQIGGQNIQPAQWYAGIASQIGNEFGLARDVLAYFKANGEHSPMQRFFGALRDVVLDQVREPIVIFIDEIDATRSLPFATDEFFAGIRECYNRRVRDPEFSRLAFCLLGVAVPKDLIRDPATTPFNVGERIHVQDFTLEEVRSFGPALGPEGDRLARQVHYWTSGQPFLTQSLCREILADRVEGEAGVDSLIDRLFYGPKAIETNLNLADVANRVLNDPGHEGDPDKLRANLLSEYERALRGASLPDDEANRVAVVLKLSGLLGTEGARLVLRNRIYRRVFNRAWIEANMPGQERIRQRQAFRRGLVRGLALTAVVGGAIGTLAVLALRARAQAVSAESALDYELYVANMNGLRPNESIGDSARMAAALEQSRTSVHRGFEWGFWLGRLHDSPEEYTLDYSHPGKDEEAVVSQDGRQICIKDKLANVAVVVDRQSKHVLGSAPIGTKAVAATRAGFVIFDREGDAMPVTEIATGRLVSKIGVPGHHFVLAGSSDQGDYVLVWKDGLSGRRDSVLEVWDLVNGSRVAEHRSAIGTMSGFYAISRTGRRIAFNESSSPASPKAPVPPARTVIWDTVENREIDSMPALLPNPVYPSFSDSGRFLSRCGRSATDVRDLDRRQTVYSTLGTGEDVPIGIAVATDDRSMGLVTSNGTASFREIPSGKLFAVRPNVRFLIPAGDNSRWIGASSTVRILDLSPSGQGVVGAYQKVGRDGFGALRLSTEHVDSVARLQDPSLAPLPAFTLPAGARNLTHNGLWCLSSDPACVKRLVSVGRGAPSVRLPFDPDNVACGLTSDVFAASEGHQQWRGISGVTGDVLWRQDPKVGFRAMWMTPDGHRLIGLTQDDDIWALDPQTGQRVGHTGAHTLAFSSLNFSRDGRQFLTGGRDGRTILWDTATLQRLVQFPGSAAQEVRGADLSPDGRRIATCNRTGAWQIWDRATGQELTEIQASSRPLDSVVFTADGRTLVTSGDDGVVRAWSSLDRDPTVRIPLPAEALKNLGQ